MRDVFTGGGSGGGSDKNIGSIILDAEGGEYGATAQEDGKPVRRKRHTFGGGEHPENYKYATWTIEDDSDSMDDFGIVINILCDLAPSGMLPLSFGMIGTGYVSSLIMLFFFVGAAGYTMYLIARTMEVTGEQSFSRMWSKIYGENTMWVPICIILSVTWGCLLQNVCMVGDILGDCLPMIFSYSGFTRSVCIIGCSVFPLLPLCMIKDLSFLAPTSAASLIMVLYTLFGMAYRYYDASYFEGGAYFGKPTGGHRMTFTTTSFMLVNGFALAYLTHYNGCKYYREYHNKTPGKFAYRIFEGYALCTAMFVFAMFYGYMTFGPESEIVILNNYALDDSLMNIARVGMAIANTFSFPLMFSGMREQSLELITYLAPSMEKTCSMIWFQNTFSAFNLVVITIIGCLIKDCGLVVGVVGSICGSATIYVLPCMLFDAAYSQLGNTGKLQYDPREKIMVRVLGTLGVFLMGAGLYATLLI